MKRTTYILLAMLVLPFVVLFVLLFLMARISLTEKKQDSLTSLIENRISHIESSGLEDLEGVVYTLSASDASLELPACKAVKIVKEGVEGEKNDFSFRKTNLRVTTTDKATPVLTLPAELKKNLETRMKGDTLFVVFNFAKNRPAVCKPEEHLVLEVEGMELSIPATVQQVDLQTRFMKVLGRVSSHWDTEE